MAVKARSTLIPVLAEVSIKATLYSFANRSPSSFRITRSLLQSHLLPKKISVDLYVPASLFVSDGKDFVYHTCGHDFESELK